MAYPARDRASVEAGVYAFHADGSFMVHDDAAIIALLQPRHRQPDADPGIVINLNTIWSS
jgi:hypothetical protein